MNQYQKSYTNFLQRFLKPKKPLKVVFDCSNGTTGIILEKLFQLKVKRKKLKGKKHYNFINFKFLNSIPDGNFPNHSPDPLTKGATSQLKKAVLKNKADLGVIFDGDGDRARFVDNKGRDINPDIIARILIWKLNPKTTVIDVLTGWAVKNLKTENKKMKIISSKVGHQFISENMKRNKADLGIEYSGHYYFKLFNYNDSGILTAIEIINAASEMPFSLSQFTDLLDASFRETLAILQKQTAAVKSKLRKVEKFYQKSASPLRRIEANKISSVDGLSVEARDFWFNLRLSNTEPVLRFNIEAKSAKELAKQKKRVLNLIKSPKNEFISNKRIR